GFGPADLARSASVDRPDAQPTLAVGPGRNRDEQEVLAVRQPHREAVTRDAVRRIRMGQLRRRATGGGYTEDAAVRERREQDGAVLAPRAAARCARLADALGGARVQRDL